jgi:hypothetical protein
MSEENAAAAESAAPELTPISTADVWREGATSSIDDLIGDLPDTPEPAEDFEDEVEEETTDEVEVEDESEDDVEDSEDAEESDDDAEASEDDVEEVELSEEDLLEQTVKVKINGEDAKVTVQEAVDNYQLGLAARSKFEQATKMRQQSEQFINLLSNKDTIWNVIQQLGHDPDTLAEEYIVERIKVESMSPEEKRAMEAERRYEEMARKAKQLEDQQNEATLKSQQKEYAERIQADINEALDSVGLIKNKRTVAKVAQVLAQGLQNDMQLTPTQAARIAKKEITEDISNLLSDSSESALEKIMAGDESKVKTAKQARNKKIVRRKKVSKTSLPVTDKLMRDKKIDSKDPDAFNKLFNSIGR